MCRTLDSLISKNSIYLDPALDSRTQFIVSLIPPIGGNSRANSRGLAGLAEAKNRRSWNFQRIERNMRDSISSTAWPAKVTEFSQSAPTFQVRSVLLRGTNLCSLRRIEFRIFERQRTPCRLVGSVQIWRWRRRNRTSFSKLYIYFLRSFDSI